jgi:hypothetical protein
MASPVTFGPGRVPDTAVIHGRAVSEANDQPISLKKIRYEPFNRSDSPEAISQTR